MNSIEVLKKLLPDHLAKLLCDYPLCEELRLRVGQPVSVSIGEENILIPEILSEDALRRIFISLCEGSVHAHEHTLQYGYFTIRDCIRVGVASKIADWNGHGGVRTVTALNIRISRPLYHISTELCALMRKHRYGIGVLLYGPPGCGKTTLLRDLIYQISSPPHLRRTVAVDSRCELRDTEAMQSCLCDFLEGYPKAQGISLAIRSLNPQILACDEIGSAEDVHAVLSSQNTGVSLVATAHGTNLQGLRCRAGIDTLCQSGVFRYAAGIVRSQDKMQLHIEEIKIRGAIYGA